VTGASRRETGSSWAPIDLSQLPVREKTPTGILRRTGGGHLFYPGTLHSVFGYPEALKSWLALVAVVEQIKVGNTVTYFDFEDRAERVRDRLTALGAPTESLSLCHYIRPNEATHLLREEQIEALLSSRPVLAVFDGVTEAMALANGDATRSDDVAFFYAWLPMRFVSAGAAVVLIDHVTKQSDGRTPFGSIHKLAGIDIGYSVFKGNPFTPGGAGSSTIRIEKDRTGYARGLLEPGETALAKFMLFSSPDGAVSAVLGSASSKDAADLLNADLQIRIIELLRGKEMSATEVLRAVRRRAESVVEAVDELVSDGALTMRREGQKKLYRLAPDMPAFE
jgi:DNA-binding transcriptional ArsR family regulator